MLWANASSPSSRSQTIHICMPCLKGTFACWWCRSIPTHVCIFMVYTSTSHITIPQIMRPKKVGHVPQCAQDAPPTPCSSTTKVQTRTQPPRPAHDVGERRNHRKRTKKACKGLNNRNFGQIWHTKFSARGMIGEYYHANKC